MLVPWILPTRRPRCRGELAGRYQACIGVERASVHSVNRKRVQRVVLEDKEHAPRPSHSEEFAEPEPMLVVWYMVEHTG